MDKLVQRGPLGRLAETHKIAQCVVSLPSEDAGFITGATLSVNGRFHMD